MNAYGIPIRGELFYHNCINNIITVICGSEGRNYHDITRINTNQIHRFDNMDEKVLKQFIVEAFADQVLGDEWGEIKGFVTVCDTNSDEPGSSDIVNCIGVEGMQF